MARGHLVKRAERSLSLVVELERDPTTGKRRQKWTTFKGLKRDAEKELARLGVEVEKGTIGNAGRVTTGEFLERWLAEHARPNLSPATALRYTGLVRNQIVPYIGRVPLEKLRAAHVLALKTKLRQAPRGGASGAASSPRCPSATPTGSSTPRWPTPSAGS